MLFCLGKYFGECKLFIRRFNWVILGNAHCFNHWLISLSLSLSDTHTGKIIHFHSMRISFRSLLTLRTSLSISVEELTETRFDDLMLNTHLTQPIRFDPAPHPSWVLHELFAVHMIFWPIVRDWFFNNFFYWAFRFGNRCFNEQRVFSLFIFFVFRVLH